MIGKRLSCVAVVLAVGLVGAGCGGGSEATSPSGSATNRTLVYATPALATSLDPCNNTGGTNSEVINNLYGNWTDYEYVPGTDDIEVANTADGEQGIKQGAPTAIFESWDVSSDGRTYTFEIRAGVQDSFGTPFTADDAKWVFTRSQESTGCNWVTGSLNITDAEKQITAVDDQTLKIELPAPNASFLRVLNVNNGMAIGATARQHTTDDDPWANEWMKKNSPALGAYTVTKWTPGVEIVFGRNPNWFGPKPYYDKIVYRQVPESSNRVALLLNGQAQAARDLSQEELSQVEESSSAQNACVTGNDFTYVPLSGAKDKPLANLKVRQALAYAMPYDEIVDSVYRGRARRMYGAVPSGYSSYLGDEAYPYNTDYDKAKQLLAEAGYPDGFDASITINQAVPTSERVAVLVQESFSNIGVNLQIDSKPDAAYTTTIFNRKFDMAVYPEHSYVLDMVYHSLIWFSTPGQEPPNFNMTGFSNSEFDETIAKGKATADGPERDELMKRSQEILIEELPVLPAANQATCFSFGSGVTGYKYRPSDQVMFYDLKPK